MKKTVKRILSASMVLLLLMYPVTAYADDVTADTETEDAGYEEQTLLEELADIEYDAGDYSLYFRQSTQTINGVVLMGYKVHDDVTGDLGDLEIPNGVEGQPVIEIGESAFNGCTRFKGNLILPNEVEIIHNYAFSGSTFSGTLSLPSSLKTIGNAAFQNCRYFTGDLVIPDSVHVVGVSAFDSCYGFDGTLTLSSSMKEIINGSFSNLTNMTGNLVIPEGVTKVGDSAFYNCCALNGTLTLPSTLTYIERRAFGACEKLSGTLNLPNGLEYIGARAFNGCKCFTGKLVIPDSVTELGPLDYRQYWTGDAFAGCSGFTGLELSENIDTIYNGNFYFCDGMKGNLVIPDSVKSIERGAFKSTRFTTITLPSQLETIGDIAFQDCKGLTAIPAFPDTLQSIGEDAFDSCENAGGAVTIPDSVTSIGNGAFSNCYKLEGPVTLSKNLTAIPGSMFYYCTKLGGQLVIPDKVKTIGWGAFSKGYDSNVTSFTGDLILPEGLQSIDGQAFQNNRNMKGKLVIPSTATNVNYDAFKYTDFTTIENKSDTVTLRTSDLISSSAVYYDSSGNMTTTIAKGIYTKGSPESTISIGEGEVTLPKYSYAYTGSNLKIKPTVVVRNKTLKEGTDYTVSYNNNKQVGTGHVIVTGKGKYTGTVVTSFMICFKDVPETHNFSRAVYWALEEGITGGYTGSKAGLFGVNDPVQRGQVVMFLWRAAEKPEPKGNKQTFKDVPTSHAFYKAIQWASEEGITAGYSDGNFGVKDNCTRGQIAMFLWRFADKPKPKGNKQSFKDVPVKHPFYQAIQWGKEEGIIGGYTGKKAGLFGVNDSCTRGQMAMFLWRGAGKP